MITLKRKFILGHVVKDYRNLAERTKTSVRHDLLTSENTLIPRIFS